MPRTVASRKALQQELQRALGSRLGFHHFRENQEAAVINAMEGRDTLVLANTGAGKSLCFILPALMGRGMVLVVSPLIALMQNQVQSLRAKGVAAEYLASSRSAAERRDVLQRMESGSSAPELVFITPESVTAAPFKKVLRSLADRNAVALIAVDEAHCISSWGHDFRPSYRRLAALPKLLPSVPVMALTATATAKVQGDIASSLCLRSPKILRTSFNRPNIHYSVKYIEEDEEVRIKDLVKSLHGLSEVSLQQRRQQQQQPHASCFCAIIYARKRETTELLAKALSSKGLPCAAYHGGMKDSDRKKVLQEWTDGTVPIVAATIAFGMGIDKADVRAVVHFTLPKSLEGFYQESGRAGRDGLASRSILYYSRDDAASMRWLVDKETDKESDKKRQKTSSGPSSVSSAPDNNEALQAFNKVQSLAMGERCRRTHILGHFGESFTAVPGAQGCCDWCDDEALVRSRMMQARAIADARRAARGTSAAAKTREGMTGGYKLEFEQDGFDKAEDDDNGEDSGDEGSDEDDNAEPGAAFAKDVLHQAKSAGYDVLDAMERAEQLHSEHEAAQELMGGRRSKLLQRLGSGGSLSGNREVSTGHSASRAPPKKGKGLGIKDDFRSQVAQQIEKAMQKNENLKDSPLESISAVAAKLEKEAYEVSASKPVYRSKIASAKMSAAQACSLEDLAGSDSGCLQATTPASGAPCSGAEGLQGSCSDVDKDTAVAPKGDRDASAAGAAAEQEPIGKVVQPPDAALPEAAHSHPPDDLRDGLRRKVESCEAMVSAAQGAKGESCAKAEAMAALVDLESYPVTIAMLKETRVNEKLLAWKALSDQMPDIAAASKAVLRAWKRHCNIGKKQPGAAP